jgi:type II secretory pathway predicted ATPase ExeA
MSHLLSSRKFFPSAASEEALARLDYLVAQQHRLGVLVGPRGCGKSLVLRQAATAWRRASRNVALISATALEADSFLAQLATEWQNAAPVNADRAGLWQAVTEALRVHHCEQRATVLLLDDCGSAPFEVLDLVARLASAGDAMQPRLSIVLAVDNARLSHLGTALLDRTDLRIELTPFEATETGEFLEAQLRVQSPSPRLADGAATRLHALTAGLPRRLNRLTELVMLAVRAEGRDEIDVPTIDAVYRELSVQSIARPRS